MGCEGTRPTEAVKPIMAPRGFSCLPTSSTTYYLFILIRTALLLYCSSLFFNCYFTSHYLLCLIALPQDLLYDYFFWRYRPLLVVTTPPQLPASKPPIFHPWVRSFSPDFLLWPLPGLLARAIILCSVGTEWIFSYEFQSPFFLKCEVIDMYTNPLKRGRYWERPERFLEGRRG